MREALLLFLVPDGAGFLVELAEGVQRLSAKGKASAQLGLSLENGAVRPLEIPNQWLRWESAAIRLRLSCPAHPQSFCHFWTFLLLLAVAQVADDLEELSSLSLGSHGAWSDCRAAVLPETRAER